jgi:hypothetical protein
MSGRLPPIAFQPRPSRQLASLLLCLQGVTLTVLILAPLPVGVRLPLLVGLLVQCLLSHRRFHGSSRHRITQVRIDHEHAARLVFADGRTLQTRLRGDSLITPWLILLRFEDEHLLRRPTLLLGRDSLAADEMRRLRILLRFG